MIFKKSLRNKSIKGISYITYLDIYGEEVVVKRKTCSYIMEKYAYLIKDIYGRKRYKKSHKTLNYQKALILSDIIGLYFQFLLEKLFSNKIAVILGLNKSMYIDKEFSEVTNFIDEVNDKDRYNKDLKGYTYTIKIEGTDYIIILGKKKRNLLKSSIKKNYGEFIRVKL